MYSIIITSLETALKNAIVKPDLKTETDALSQLIANVKASDGYNREMQMNEALQAMNKGLVHPKDVIALIPKTE